MPQLKPPKEINQIDDSGAAIVCSHIAVNGRPILRATRSDPLSKEDSGWQFLCNSTEKEDEEQAQVWSLKEVLELDLTLEPYLNKPSGTTLIKNAPLDDWEVILLDNED